MTNGLAGQETSPIEYGDVMATDHPAFKETGVWKQLWNHRRLSGWRAGAILSCATALTVLLINSTFLIWIVRNKDIRHGTGTVFEGSCEKAKSLNTWLGLAINVLCSILLGASNYCMQCLTSPTREEVDIAHAEKRLLQIGVPSMRNLKAMGRDRVFLWLGLGLSAMPLHFV